MFQLYSFAQRDQQWLSSNRKMSNSGTGGAQQAGKQAAQTAQQAAQQTAAAGKGAASAAYRSLPQQVGNFYCMLTSWLCCMVHLLHTH